jgi:hypothetical protein
VGQFGIALILQYIQTGQNLGIFKYQQGLSLFHVIAFAYQYGPYQPAIQMLYGFALGVDLYVSLGNHSPADRGYRTPEHDTAEEKQYGENASPNDAGCLTGRIDRDRKYGHWCSE